MKRTALTVGALIAFAIPATPAMAGSGSSTFDLELRTGQASVAEVAGDLVALVRTAWDSLEPGDWDPARFGPWDVVRNGAACRVSAPLPGDVAVTIDLTVAMQIPSESSTATELARRLLVDVQERAERRLVDWRTRRIEPLAAAAVEGRLALVDASTGESAHRKTWGDAATEHALVAGRLRAAAEDLASARVDRAVAAARLEAATRAAELAYEVEDLQREIARVEANETDSDETRALLASLRLKLRLAGSRTPPVDEARRRMFDLEIEMVGLEARISALEPEIADLRVRVVELARARSDAMTHEAAVAGARTDLAEAERGLRRAERDARAVTLIASGPRPR